MKIGAVVKRAKEALLEIMNEEGVTNLGLEEITFDDTTHAWRTILGFSRPWDSDGSLDSVIGRSKPERHFREITVDDKDGNVISIKRA